MHSEGVDDYVYDNTELVTNFQKLITKNFSLLKDKKGKELSDVDLYINFFNHHLIVHQMKINIFYPLHVNYVRLKAINPTLDESKAKTFINVIDLEAKSSFVTMCGFQIETILKKIVKTHNIEMNNQSMRTRFQSVLEYFEIPLDDKLDLIDVYYWTRNTLHNGGRVDKIGKCVYGDFTYVFEINKPLNHTRWNHLTYFVSEIIGIFEQILNSEKYVEVFEEK